MSEVSIRIPQKLYAVTVGVNDVGRQRGFYEGWGWQALPYSNEEYVAFDLAGSIVAFAAHGVLGAEAAPGESVAGGGWSGFALAINLPNREDVDTTFQAAVDAGAHAISKPEDRAWGGRSAFVADPEGHRWEIVWVPADLLGA
jgi:uncharacterized glyoxalase superfamily protein PhnB